MPLAPRSLRARVLSAIALAVAPIAALIVVSAWEERSRAAAEAERQTQQLAIVVIDEQQRIIAQTKQLLGVLASLPAIGDRALSAPECQKVLARVRRQNPIYANLGVTDRDGNLLCSAVPFTSPINFADRAWFRRPMANHEFSVGEYLIGRLTGIPSVGLGQPLVDADGEAHGVIYATIDLAWLQQLSSKLPLPTGAVVVVVDTNGTVLMRQPDPDRRWIGQPAPEGDMLAGLLASGCSGSAEIRGQDGVSRLNTIRPLQKVDGKCVYVRVGVPTEEVYRPVVDRLWRDLLVLALGAVLVLMVAWIGSDILVLQPVRALTLAARRLGQGDLSARTGLPHSGGELGALAASFDRMTADIQAREQRLVAADRAIKRANRALGVLSTGNQAMLRAGDEQELLDGICRIIVERGGYAMAWVGFLDPDSPASIRPVAHCGIELNQIDCHCLRADPAAGEMGTPGRAIREVRATLLRHDGNEPPPGCLIDAGCRSVLSLPIRDDNTAFGVLSIYAREADAFDAGEIELLTEAAGDLAFGIGRLRDQARRREAEDANKVKSEFLANMSHELRTPLNAIIGFSDVLKDGLMGDLTPRQKEYVTDIYDSGQHLLALINDILDLSKVEAGKMTLDLETRAIPLLLERSLSIVREKAAAHRIELALDVPADLPSIRVDPRKSMQIVYNLLANALKFTADGGRVLVTARLSQRQDVEAWHADTETAIRLPLPASEFRQFLEITVEDDGIGIGRDDAPRLFKPFSQIDSSFSRHYPGTGLGLVMVMRLATLHEGTVAVASTPGVGSRFTVWLPWREGDDAGTQAADPGAPPDRARPLALVVEDNDSAANLERVQLESVGLSVLRVSSAEDALAIGNRHLPAVIILDVFLPGMDGWEFLARIKQPDSPWHNVPVVIASISDDTSRGYSLGAAQVLQKPITRDELADALHHIGLLRHEEATILIVDDDPKSIEVLATYLAGNGYRILRAAGGQAGIDMVRQHRPDLILLDLMMPEVSGFDVVLALRDEKELAGIPVIVVTAKQLTANDCHTLNGSITAIIEKGRFGRDEFLTEVRRALSSVRKETA